MILLRLRITFILVGLKFYKRHILWFFFFLNVKKMFFDRKKNVKNELKVINMKFKLIMSRHKSRKSNQIKPQKIDLV